MRTHVHQGLALIAAAAAWSLLGGCNNNNTPSTPGSNPAPAKTSVALIGDIPYGTSNDDTAQFDANPAFIRAINADPNVSLVMHAGDIHSGKQFCTESYDVSIYSQWTAYQDPLVYTPGDNEWADCHKFKEGGGQYNATTGQVDFRVDANGALTDYAGGDPLANLDLVRSLFFPDAQKAFGGKMDVNSQASAFDSQHPTDSRYIENVWFKKSSTLFITVNIPGGSNNGTDPWYGTPTMSPTQAQDVENRTGAALRWLKVAFDQALKDKVSAVVIVEQADMWDLDGAPATHIANYKPYIDQIAAFASAFGKPVLLVNGDSHIYRSDNPLKAGAPCAIEPAPGQPATACTDDAYANQPHGYDVSNFHRITVHGSTMPMEWLKLDIDLSANAAASENAFGPFSWSRQHPAL